MEFVDRLSFAKVLVAIGDLMQAEMEMVEVLDTKPDDLDGLSLFAKIKHMRGELTAAIACWAQIHARTPTNEQAQMHLASILHLARDPEKGAGEFVALGQYQLVRKPAAYLALEAAFECFLARKPADARAHCMRVAEKHRSDRELYKLAVLADAWISELSGELPTAVATLEQLGLERGFETDFDRIMALVRLYEQLGTAETLNAAVNICRYLENTNNPRLVLGRLAILYWRLNEPDRAQAYADKHLAFFQRGMHRPYFAQAVQVAANQYLPLARLQAVDWCGQRKLNNADRREEAVAAALLGNLTEARKGFALGRAHIDNKYLADVAFLLGEVDEARDRFLTAARDTPADMRVLGWILDHLETNTWPAAEEFLRQSAIAAALQPQLEAATQLDPANPLVWRRWAAFARLQQPLDDQAVLAEERANALDEAVTRRKLVIGRILAAAVYNFMGKGKGLTHEVWASREPTTPGQGGSLPAEAILGNLTGEMQTNVRNTFLAVREYARAKFPHLTDDIQNFNYTYKVTKEDEPSGGTSAGLPTALVFLSVFLQRPLPQDVAASGAVLADSHDVLVVHNVGDVAYKVKAAYHRELRAIILPRANEAELNSSADVPRRISEKVVHFVADFDQAVRFVFGDGLLP